MSNLDTGSLWVDSELLGVLPTKLTEEYPSLFRFGKYPDGSKKLQGGYVVTEGFRSSIEWKDLVCVDVDENGQEIK